MVDFPLAGSNSRNCDNAVEVIDLSSTAATNKAFLKPNASSHFRTACAGGWRGC